MARLPRLRLAGQVHHVIQRGNNRQAIFIDSADRERMLALLGEHAAAHGISVHAFVLLDGRMHLLATPASADGLSKWMQAVGRAYVRYFNDRHSRTGTLWEGRFRSTLVQPDRHLLACMVYMDWSPVKEGSATAPESHAWSSHAHYVGLRADRLVTPHAQYWGLGNTPFAREAAYAELVRAGLSPSAELELVNATLHGWALGDADFIAQLEVQNPRRLTRRKPGRPSGITQRSPEEQ